jgi:glutathione peroxidase-family protein
MASMHDFEMQSITGDPVKLSSFAGKVCLVVNLASK